MSDNKKSHCWLNLHNDQIHKEVYLTDVKGAAIGLVIINRCVDCGRIKSKRVVTVDHRHN